MLLAGWPGKLCIQRKERANSINGITFYVFCLAGKAEREKNIGNRKSSLPTKHSCSNTILVLLF